MNSFRFLDYINFLAREVKEGREGFKIVTFLYKGCVGKGLILEYNPWEPCKELSIRPTYHGELRIHSGDAGLKHIKDITYDMNINRLTYVENGVQKNKRLSKQVLKYCVKSFNTRNYSIISQIIWNIRVEEVCVSNYERSVIRDKEAYITEWGLFDIYKYYIYKSYPTTFSEFVFQSLNMIYKYQTLDGLQHNIYLIRRDIYNLSEFQDRMRVIGHPIQKTLFNDWNTGLTLFHKNYFPCRSWVLLYGTLERHMPHIKKMYTDTGINVAIQDEMNERMEEKRTRKKSIWDF